VHKYYTLCVSCVPSAHGLCDSALHDIYRSVVVAKLLYASSAWEGFANATNRNKIQSFISKSKRNGYCSPDLPDFNSLCTSLKVDLFNKVLKIPTHVLHPLLPPPVSHTQRYGLRPRVRDRTLPERSSNIVDCNFIIRMLYMNAYWLNNGLFYVTSMLCFTLLYVVALCVKMRYVILCIKRLSIDWLIAIRCQDRQNLWPCGWNPVPSSAVEKCYSYLYLHLRLLIKVSMCEVVEDSTWHSLLLSVPSSLCCVVSCECCQTQHEMERWNVESRLFGSRTHMSSASRSFAWQCRGGNGQCQLAALNILVSHFELGSRGSMNVWLRQFYDSVLYITQLLQQLPQIDCVQEPYWVYF